MVSMKEIAAACGVSVATVSKALRGHRDIGEKTRSKIRETADEMGYFPNQSARYLKTNRSYNIGVLFEDAAKGGLTHDFFASVLQGLKQRAEERGYDVTFLNTNSQEMSYLERARCRGFDGVAIVCFDFANPQIQELLQSDMKVVTVDYVADSHTAVVSDNTQGMTQLMKYILRQGHRKIAYIHGDMNRVTKLRLAAYYRSLEDHGIRPLEDYVTAGYYRDVELAYRKTRALLELEEPPTCILYPDDVASFGGIRAIFEKGLRIPEDISVAGYDGTGAAQYAEPQLTTYRQNASEMGRLAAENLIDEIEKPMTAIPGIHRVQGYVVEGRTVKNLAEEQEAVRKENAKAGNRVADRRMLLK